MRDGDRDTVVDVGFIGYDLYGLYRDNIRGNCDNLGSNLLALGLDAAGALIPGVTGLGAASRHADDIARGLGAVPEAERSITVIGRQWDTAVAKDWPGHEVLSIDNWNLEKNDAWVAAGIEAGQNFYVASPRRGNLVQSSGPYAGVPTVFARELEQLLAAGYQEVRNYLVHPANVATFRP